MEKYTDDADEEDKGIDLLLVIYNKQEKNQKSKENNEKDKDEHTHPPKIILKRIVKQMDQYHEKMKNIKKKIQNIVVIHIFG